ncbi:MAG: pentapeptide repeat-containing protein, partial [Gemmatimonadetes bacterium]|nr:pentapeptide repeat-containing protein [Gemmatimonadota bacterium]
ITARFSKAIEHLGDERLSVRLGGIYALERIARDSHRDHFTVMETLTAFVRERACYRGPREGMDPIAADVQAVLTVVGRRERAYEEGTAFFLDLSRTDLSLADLNGTHLERARLHDAHLERARLHDAQLEGAALHQAHLEHASLYKAHLEGAVLMGVRGKNAYLGAAHLQGADLRGADLEGAYMDLANLEGADLRGVVGLTPEQLQSAISDETTLLPPGLREALGKTQATAADEEVRAD